ncbi:ABC transporter substrate-binding protein [Desertimonas flava]|uniref:ABC transporter substrate-binding protein n=1 Tax=Desertimonas flava TaxID=2064846 RepID=UPI0013C46EE1|nr:ABC transporter substrate-binding protein [Desertimonas flava]
MTLAAFGSDVRASIAPDEPTGELRVGEALAWMSWDPLQVIRAGYDMAWFRPVYEPLFEVGPDLSLESTLLAGWDLTSEYLDLTLIDGITFQDGTALDAEALKFNLLRARDTEGPSQSLFASVADVEIVDPLSVRVVLATPTPHLPYVLAKDAGMMVSPAAAEAGTLETEPVGTGPWVLNTDETQADAQAVYDAWDGYRDPSQQRIARIVIYPGVFGPEPFAAGDLDISYFADPQRSAMEGANGAIASEPYGGGTLLSFIDRGSGGVFEDVRVREAVAAAIDREALNAAVGNGGDPRAVPVAGDDYAASEELTGHPFEPDRAESLLADAGVEGLSFSIPVYPPVQAIGEALQALLREQGIEMELVPITGSIFAECSSGKYEACMFTDSASHPAQMYDLMVSAETFLNPSGVESEEVAAAAQAAFAEPDLATAEPLWNAWYQAVFNDDVALTYLVRSPVEMAYHPDRVETPNLTFVAPTAIDFRGLALVD